MVTPFAVALAVWTAGAVPVALVLGRALGAADRTVADEAAAYLRRRSPVRGRARRRLVALSMAVTVGLATQAAAAQLGRGDGEPAPTAAAQEPPALTSSTGVVVDLPPVADRRPRVAATPAAAPDAVSPPEVAEPAPVCVVVERLVPMTGRTCPIAPVADLAVPAAPAPLLP